MIVGQEKPSIEEALLHYGVKGMRWGVVKDDDPSSGESGAASDYKAIHKPNSPKTLRQRNERTLETTTQFVEKHEPPAGRSGLSPETKKKLIYGIAGGLAVAAVVGGAYYAKKNGVTLPNLNLDSYMNATKASRLNAINADFITKASFDRKGFTLPKGHTFLRISSGAEKSFGHVTYASASDADFNRYVAQLGHVMSTKVTFKSNQPVKVSSMTSALETLREVLGGSAGRIVDREEALSTYRELIGGKWDSPLAADFFSAMKKKGFSALVDEMDAGVISENPLIIFNHDGLGKKVSKSMSKADIAKALGLVSDFVNRK
jgi:hypothetical protein